MELFDAHVHLDWMSDARAVAADAAAQGLVLFANTVTPEGFLRAQKVFGDFDNVYVGVGLHPWWVASADLDAFDRYEPQTSWVGEVGVDLSPKRAHHERQVAVFRHIARRCAQAGDKTISIHSVRAADAVLDILEETNCTKHNRCIFHWFSGSTEALWRAIRLGCWFSVNEMQASTRRAKEQLKLVPSDRLLLETDLPPAQDAAIGTADIAASLERARNLVERIRQRPMTEQLAQNWERLAARKNPHRR